MSTGYYFIYDTCPDLYDKMVKKITSQFKKDKTPFIIAEIDSPVSKHWRACNDITARKKPKICQVCPHKDIEGPLLGRKKSDKLTMISIGGTL